MIWFQIIRVPTKIVVGGNFVIITEGCMRNFVIITEGCMRNFAIIPKNATRAFLSDKGFT